MRIDDQDIELGAYSNICSLCRHKKDGRTCFAFSNGIPETIWLGKNNHIQPYPGDNGIRFEPIEQEPAE